jgi:hypothetical protein
MFDPRKETDELAALAGSPDLCGRRGESSSYRDDGKIVG